MMKIDWRELYAQNQAAIASGLRVSPTTLPTLPAGYRAHPASNSVSRGADHPNGVLAHVPSDLDPDVPAAAVCMLHGCTQDPATFAAATAMNATADRYGFVVVYPGQPRARNSQGCWNWFLPAHQQRGEGEPGLIAGIARRLTVGGLRQAVDPARVFVAGLSSGGAMAIILAACYPDVFAAVAIHSGLPYRSAGDMASAFAAMGGASTTRPPDGHCVHAAMGEHARAVPSLVIHGTGDRTVAPENAAHVLTQMMHANHLAAPDVDRHDPSRPTVTEHARSDGGLLYRRDRWFDARAALVHEAIEIQDLGHAWSGGTPGGSYTDPRGPSASAAIWAFFSEAGRVPRPASDRPADSASSSTRCGPYSADPPPRRSDQ